MKVMGLDELWLVAPEDYPADAADALRRRRWRRARRGDRAPSLRSAVADCGLIVGTTARNRELPWRIVEPRAAASESAACGRPEVAILFGSERTGLVNAELEQCQRLITIPSRRPTSLNLAMAVQIVAYELWLARGARLDRAGAHRAARERAADMEKFYDHLVEVLDEIDFRDRTGEGYLLARLRRLFNRAVLDQNEVNILRGILTAVQGRRRRAGDPTTVRGRVRR